MGISCFYCWDIAWVVGKKQWALRQSKPQISFIFFKIKVSYEECNGQKGAMSL